MYRQGSWDKAREYAQKALAVDTYDPAANYFMALASEKTGNDQDALDGFSVATLSPGYRHAAWLQDSVPCNEKEGLERGRICNK